MLLLLVLFLTNHHVLFSPDSLHKFPRRGAPAISSLQTPQQPEEQQPVPQNSNQSGQNSAPTTGMQVSASGNGDATSNNSLNCAPSTSAPSPSVAGLLQGSINCRQEHPTSSGNSLYNGGNNAAVAKANSTNSMQSNPQASFPSPAPSASNGNMMPAPQHSSQMNSPTISSGLPPMQTPTSRPQEPESNESQSSVQRILQEMMMQSQMNGVGQVGSDIKRANTITPGLNGVNSLVGNPITNNAGMNGMGFGGMGGISQSMRTAMGNNAMVMNGRTGMNHSAHDLTQLSHQQQQRDIGSQLLGGLRAANSFNNLQYDWKSSQ